MRGTRLRWGDPPADGWFANGGGDGEMGAETGEVQTYNILLEMSVRVGGGGLHPTLPNKGKERVWVDVLP